ncbi:MAG: DNA-binding response regulator [Chloroflexota bacterium]|nr:MAG: DNA-binding response regulator [Chloroflexota bacterium]
MSEKSIRVLIVDDLPWVREGLATVLKLAARSVTPRLEVVGEAQNGLEAIGQLRALQPDVILMDLEMPGMDGYETTRRIKAEKPAPRVIILSIHTGPEAQQRAQAAGADGFVTKGASYEIILNAILAEEKIFNSIDPKEGEIHE